MTTKVCSVVADDRRWRVLRSTGVSRVATAVTALVVVGLFGVPQVFGLNVVEQLTSLLIFVLLAAMWNALAGYGGLVSIGQQAFIGFGAYATIFLTERGVQPYPAIVISVFVSAVLSLLLAPLMLRLRDAQFAIGMWVLAEVLSILVSLDQALGGGTGTSLQGLNAYAPNVRQAYTYWLTLGAVVVFLGLVLFLLRRPTGVALQAIRDDEAAAASLGVRVGPLKVVLFVVAGAGCGAAGALLLANTLFIEPTSIFGVQFTAYMIFMVLVGGIGTFEGPILGAVVFFVIQYEFANLGAWYLIGLGVGAIVFALFLPRGLWSLVTRRLRTPLLPIGYRLVPTTPPALTATEVHSGDALRDTTSPPRA
jgi:branched-chain amino acid transport system permease protein